MRDTTGQDWLRHFLHGTCVILRLQQPAGLVAMDASAAQRRSFFLATRIFEIARALIYSQPTFLSDQEWVRSLSEWWASDEGTVLWTPKESLFDMLPQFSDLGLRALKFSQVEGHELSADTQSLRSQALAEEGLALHSWLQDWWNSTMAWKSNRGSLDVDLLIAENYYHAISIYLSGTYDYHDHWGKPDTPMAPILDRPTICWHMLNIVRLSQELLEHGIMGLFLLIPLRIAGARALDSQDQDVILQLLRTVSHRGYAVADAIHVDLVELWSSKVW